MRYFHFVRANVIMLALALIVTAPASARSVATWRTPDPQNVLVFDTSKGRIFIELYPQIAPKAVERIKLLARRGTYDGLQFWRVIPGFVAQTGDPDNHDGGKTELPNLAPEFTFKLAEGGDAAQVARPQGLREGFIGAMPYIAGEPSKPGLVHAWGSFCSGVMGMGRDEAIDSANAEIFFMLAATPRLDRDYTPVGRVLAGEAVLSALKTGEPALDADTMIHVHVLADLSNAPNLRVMNVQSRTFARIVAQVRRRKGADFSVCDVTVPTKVMP